MTWRTALLSLIMLALALAACGGGDSNDPSQPVKDFFTAFEEMDAEKAAEAVCQEHRNDVQTGLDMIFGFMTLTGEDAKIEVVDLELQVTDEKDDEAMVLTSGGTIKITIQEEVQEQPIGQTAEPVRVVKQDGKWLLCDVSFAEGFTP